MSKNEELIEMPKNDRKHSFFILLYPDSTSYDINDVFFELRGFKEYAYILHKPESDELKEHYHLFIHLDNACTCEAISKRLGIPVNHIKYVKSMRACLRYLSHVDYPEKIQYDFHDIICSKLLERDLYKCYCDIESEQEIISNIYDFMVSLKNDYNYSLALVELVKFVNLNCYDTVYKRYRQEFKEFLKDLY